MFYIFAAGCIASATMVVAARNPVHSVLFLILSFFMAAGLFVLIGAEFLAFILVIVYVGAVAVLFLFVVMMLDIDFTRLREGMQQYLPIGVTIGLILMFELILILVAYGLGDAPSFSGDAPVIASIQNPAEINAISNTRALGQILYTEYVLFFQIAGTILLVAMIGAIVLTLRPSERPRRQNIAVQNARRAETTVTLVKIKPGAGLK